MLKIDSSCHSKRFPYWLRRSVKTDREVIETKEIIESLRIHTVCQSARCANIYDCFSRRQCTFLILGNFCTRSCGFCSIRTGKDLEPPQEAELLNIKEAVRKLGLQNVIITSVTRDDLGDGGASHFANCIGILREFDARLNIEVLVPDFLGKKDSIKEVIFREPDVFSHNIETVPSLYKKVRPQAEYKRSLEVIRYAKELRKSSLIKSGLMVGLGETRDEVYSTMKDLKGAGCDIITIGQYLKPDSCCLDVEEFVHPEWFEYLSGLAKELSFKAFSCSPFTRSSQMGPKVME